MTGVQRAASYLKKPVTDMNIRDFVKLTKKLIRTSKPLAEELVFEQGLRGNVTQKFIRTTLPDRFTKSGDLSIEAKKAIVEDFSTDGTKTIGDLFKTLLSEASN